MPDINDSGKKHVPLRLSPALWKELSAWAADDFRSLNGQIEYLLSECVKKRRKVQAPSLEEGHPEGPPQD